MHFAVFAAKEIHIFRWVPPLSLRCPVFSSGIERRQVISQIEQTVVRFVVKTASALSSPNSGQCHNVHLPFRDFPGSSAHDRAWDCRRSRDTRRFSRSGSLSISDALAGIVRSRVCCGYSKGCRPGGHGLMLPETKGKSLQGAFVGGLHAPQNGQPWSADHRAITGKAFIL
jgi:hypothetical protein